MSETVLLLIILLSYLYYLRHTFIPDLPKYQKKIPNYIYLLVNELGFLVYAGTVLIYTLWIGRNIGVGVALVVVGWLIKIQFIKVRPL